MNLLTVLCITLLGISTFVDCRAAQELRTLLNQTPDADEKVRIEPSITSNLEHLADEKEFILSMSDNQRTQTADKTREKTQSENNTSGEHHMLRRSNELEKSSPSVSSLETSKSNEEKAVAPSKWKKGLDSFLGFVDNARRLIVAYSVPVLRFLRQHITRMLSPLPSMIYGHPAIRAAAASWTWSWMGDKLFTFLTRLQSVPQ